MGIERDSTDFMLSAMTGTKKALMTHLMTSGSSNIPWVKMGNADG